MCPSLFQNLCLVFIDTGDTDFHFGPSTNLGVFTANETVHCIDIMIETDGAVEINEIFSVSLLTMEERVNLAPGLANITIIDNDSEHFTHRNH